MIQIKAKQTCRIWPLADLDQCSLARNEGVLTYCLQGSPQHSDGHVPAESLVTPIAATAKRRLSRPCLTSTYTLDREPATVRPGWG